MSVILSLFFLSQTATSASAALLNHASYDLTRLKVSTAADHTLRFQTPTGVDAATDTIVISYPSGFNLSGIAVGDIDLLHGPATGLEISETLAAVSAAGTWGVSIAASSITFTAPTDAAAGEISANDYTVVRIGKNAAGGSGQIVNPSSAQNAVINVAGTFGDNKGMGVQIVTDDRISISAIVASTATAPEAPPPPSGGGGGGSGDTVAPVISNVQAINITSSTAEIVWTTNESSNSGVEYGLTTDYSGGLVADPSYVSQHSIKLALLQKNTVYHFRVSSRDLASNLSVSVDYTFTTLGDVAPPIISNIQVVNITDTSALILWNTDEQADSYVEYGLTALYGFAKSVPGFTTTHAIWIGGLIPNSAYHFFVASADQFGNSSWSKDKTFTTLPDSTPPANVMNFQAAEGDSVVHLTWTNSTDPDFAGTRIVRRTDAYPTGPFDGTLIYSGSGLSVDDTNVTNGTKYYYGAFAYDFNSNFASGALASATPQGVTLPPTVPPVQPPAPPPVVIPPQPIPTPGAVAVTLSPHFYTGDKTIELIPNAAGKIGVLADSQVYVYLPTVGLGAEIDKAYIVGSLFNLAPTADGIAYDGTITMPSSGAYKISVVAEIKGGGSSVANYEFVIQLRGKAVEEDAFGATDKGVADATVTLYFEHDGWKVWDGSAYGRENPIKTDSKGEYVFVVPNGRYYAVVEKEGYLKTVTGQINVENNTFNIKIGLIKKPIPLAEAVAKAEIVENLGERISFEIATARNALRQMGIEDLAEKVLSPALLAIMLANLASVLPSFNIVTYLQYLFSQPILLLRRRSKKQWGVVYNSLTKQPIKLAIIRLMHAETRVVVKTTVTDDLGRYVFIVKAGNYIIEAVRPGYLFPTQYLLGRTADVDFVGLYHATQIFAKDGQTIAVNIPLDPFVKTETPKQVIWRERFRKIQQSAAFATLLASTAVLMVFPGAQIALITLAQVGAYLLFRRLSMKVAVKEWGLAYDKNTRKPLERTIVRIFDKQFNKLLETKVTDKNGKYGFFVRRNVYYVTAEKEGYEKFVSQDIDLTKRDEAVVDQDIEMKRL